MLPALRRVRVLGVDVSMRCPGIASVRLLPKQDDDGRLVGASWTVDAGLALPSASGASILQSAAVLHQTCAAVWEDNSMKHASNNGFSHGEVVGAAVEGFMQDFMAGRFRTQSLFLLAQLNGITVYNLWRDFNTAPVVLMPNAVRRRLHSPSSRGAVAEDAALDCFLGTDASHVATDTAVKRAIVRRIACLDGGVKWPRKGSWSAGEPARIARRPAGDEGHPTPSEAMHAGDAECVEDWAFDVADAAAVGVAASCAALEAELAVRAAHLEALVGGVPGAASDQCQVARIGAAVLGCAGKAVRARWGAEGAAERLGRVRVAVGAAWVQALAEAAEEARSGHGASATPHTPPGSPQASAELPQWCSACHGSSCACMPNSPRPRGARKDRERGSHTSMAQGVLVWPWGGVPAGLQRLVGQTFEHAAEASTRPRTRPHTRLGMHEGDFLVLGDTPTKAANAVRTAARVAATAVTARVDGLLLDAGIRSVLDAVATGEAKEDDI